MRKSIKYFFTALIGCVPILPFLDITSFIFKSTGNDAFIMNTSKVFVFIILSLFATAALQLIFRWSKLKELSASIPSHITSIGILGTFIGIFFGLYNFDVSDLATSVPNLLEGMKLAFTTSITGLASSTVLRVSHTIIVSISDEQDDPWGAPDESVEVSIPGFHGFSSSMLAGIYTLTKKSENTEKDLSEIIKLLEEQNAILKRKKGQ